MEPRQTKGQLSAEEVWLDRHTQEPGGQEVRVTGGSGYAPGDP